jgi:hypothetical protein
MRLIALLLLAKRKARGASKKEDENAESMQMKKEGGPR